VIHLRFLPLKISAPKISVTIKMPPKDRKPKKRWTSNSDNAKLLWDLFQNGDFSRDKAPKMVYDNYYAQCFHHDDLGTFCTNFYRI
jgi:hypothetical protein